MKKVVAVLFLALLLALTMTSLISANEGEPQWACPDDFHLHEAGHHDDEHEGQHQHVGSSEDVNGDGWICVKHATEQIHVHTDNNIPLP